LDISTAIQTYPFIALCGLGAWVSRYRIKQSRPCTLSIVQFQARMYIPIWSPQIGCHLLNNAMVSICNTCSFSQVWCWSEEASLSACACAKVWLCQTTLVWQVTCSHAHYILLELQVHLQCIVLDSPLHALMQFGYLTTVAISLQTQTT